MTNKRKSVVCAAIALCALLLIVPTANGALRTYRGTADADKVTAVTLRVKTKADTKRRVLRLARVRRIAVTCGAEQAEARIQDLGIAGHYRVTRRGRFKIQKRRNGAHFVVAGKLRGRRATGIVDYDGPALVDDRRRNCQTGRVPFTVRRGHVSRRG